MKNFFYEKKPDAIWFFCIGLYVSGIIFLVVSLISHNSMDSSWFFVSSDPQPITNMGGYLGAQVSALVIYLFGRAAWLLLIPLMCSLYICITSRSLRDEWERLAAALYSVFVTAAIITTWGAQGGLIGMYFAQKLTYYCDPMGCTLFLYMSMCASAVILLRWSFIVGVQYVVAAVSYIVAIMRRYHVVSKVGHAIAVIGYGLCVQLPMLFITFTRSLFEGDAFDGTGLLLPDEDDFSYDFEPVQQLNFTLLLLQPRMPGAKLRDVVSFLYASLDKVTTSSEHTAMMVSEYTACVRDQEEESPAAPIIKKEPVKPVKKTVHYTLPNKNIFVAEKYSHEDQGVEKELQERAHVLQDKLKRFGVNGQVTAIKRGPVVTLFEYQPDIDTKLSKIIVLEDDLAMALQAMSIRIIAPIPGRSVVGFEVANNIRQDVLFSQITASPGYTKFSGSLPLVLGKGTIGEVVVVDLARMPHLLIAGSTGSGKSVALNAVLISLLCKLSPDELKLILIDPKRLEFASFTDIAHLLFPIVTSPHHAAPVLRWVVQEMEERYEKMAKRGARNIADYNERIKSDQDGLALPFIVVVIDELADLMITAGRDIEDLITRITQMARAAGIHMIVATQRPSVDVITGLIKANFPSRISFRVASRIDSRTILDTMGADRLLGRGDMLFLDASTSQLRRVHGAYVSDTEIEQVADHIRAQRKVEYLDMHQATGMHTSDLSSSDDALYQDVRKFLDDIDEISISLLQRKFRIGYNRSARIIDMLESQGLIMPQDGGKTRKVIR